MKKFALAVVFAGMATAVMADTYICKIKPAIKRGWIPESLAINHNEQSGDVVVNDNLIMHYHGKPIAGKVVANNGKRITFSWILPSVRNSQGQTTLRFNFRASYLKRSHKMVISSSPAGYENRFRGAGTCKIE